MPTPDFQDDPIQIASVWIAYGLKKLKKADEENRRLTDENLRLQAELTKLGQREEEQE